MAHGAVPIVFDNEGEPELVGIDLRSNVVSPSLPHDAVASTVAAIVQGYHESPAKLVEAGAIARQRYLDRFAVEGFRAKLNSILDAS